MILNDLTNLSDEMSFLFLSPSYPSCFASWLFVKLVLLKALLTLADDSPFSCGSFSHLCSSYCFRVWGDLCS